jgi:predicted nucleic acid-binding protein
MLRIVLDTNQLVKALMRPPELATFVMAWESRRFTILCSAELLAEYRLVLNYPEIALLIYPELLRAFQSHTLCLHFCRYCQLNTFFLTTSCVRN